MTLAILGTATSGITMQQTIMTSAEKMRTHWISTTYAYADHRFTVKPSASRLLLLLLLLGLRFTVGVPGGCTP